MLMLALTLLLGAAFGGAQPETFLARPGRPFNMWWRVPTGEAADRYVAFCFFYSARVAEPAVFFKITRENTGEATFNPDPFGGRADIVYPFGAPTLSMVLAIDPVRVSDAGKYSCVVQSGDAIAKLWTRTLRLSAPSNAVRNRKQVR